MKKILLIWSLLLLQVAGAYSQLSTYTFTQTAGTYIAVAGGTTLVNGTVDTGVSPVTSIGFTFNLDGTNYTQFSATSNGWVRLGATAGSTSSTPSVRQPICLHWPPLDVMVRPMVLVYTL